GWCSPPGSPEGSVACSAPSPSPTGSSSPMGVFRAEATKATHGFPVVVGSTVLVFLPALGACPRGPRGFAHDAPEERVVEPYRGTFLKPGPVRVGQAEQRSQTELERSPDEHPVERAREPMSSEGGRGEGVDRACHGTVSPVHEFDGGHASMLGYRPQD